MNTDDSTENENDSFENEQIEQLLRANEQLRQQLASLSGLSASLAQQQQHAVPGDALVWFGAGVQKRYLNARSIRLLSLQEGLRLGDYDQMSGPSGTFMVMVDELPVGNLLPPEEAELALDEVAELINRVLQPPER